MSRSINLLYSSFGWRLREMHGQGKHTENMEQDIKTATGKEHPEPKNMQDSKKHPSFGRSLLTTLPMNENTVRSKSPEFLLLVLFSWLLLAILFLQQFKEKKKSSYLSNTSLLCKLPLHLVPSLKVKRILNIIFSNLSHGHPIWFLFWTPNFANVIKIIWPTSTIKVNTAAPEALTSLFVLATPLLNLLVSQNYSATDSNASLLKTVGERSRDCPRVYVDSRKGRTPVLQSTHPCSQSPWAAVDAGGASRASLRPKESSGHRARREPAAQLGSGSTPSPCKAQPPPARASPDSRGSCSSSGRNLALPAWRGASSPLSS